MATTSRNGFTDRYLRYLGPAEKAYEKRDRNGFAIRVLPSGVKSFQYIYTFAGRRRRMSLGIYPAVSLADATDKHTDARSLLLKGIDPAEKKKKDDEQKREADQEARRALNVADLVAEYMCRWAKPNKRSWREDERILNRDVVPILGRMKARDVTRRDIVKLIDRIVDRGSPMQANRTLSVVKRMFQFATTRGVIEMSPAAVVEKPAKETPRSKVLTEDEILHLWNGEHRITALTHTAFKMILLTAQRPGEVLGMRWDELDREQGFWQIPATRTKNARAHQVPMSSMALELLEFLWDFRTSPRWVFPSHKFASDGPVLGTSLANSARKLCRGAWTPHDLRRTAATGMSKLGFHRLIVDKVLNHVDNTVGGIYDRHDYLPEMRGALEKWERELRRILGEPDDSSVVPIRRA